MKKFILPLAILLAACNNNESKTTPEVKPADVQIVEQIDNGPQLFFASVAGSAIPIEIISNSNGTFSVKYTEDGTPAEIIMKKEPLMVDGKPNAASGEVKLKGDQGSLVIAPSTCQGGTHSCTITLGVRVVEGCGKYAE